MPMASFLAIGLVATRYKSPIVSSNFSPSGCRHLNIRHLGHIEFRLQRGHKPLVDPLESENDGIKK